MLTSFAWICDTDGCSRPPLWLASNGEEFCETCEPRERRKGRGLARIAPPPAMTPEIRAAYEQYAREMESHREGKGQYPSSAPIIRAFAASLPHHRTSPSSVPSASAAPSGNTAPTEPVAERLTSSPSRQVSCWLVQNDDKRWLQLAMPFREGMQWREEAWTSDANSAIKCETEDQAHSVIRQYCGGGLYARPVEHFFEENVP